MAKKWVFFTALNYVVPEDFERYLEIMARQGWHPDRIGGHSGAVMTFSRAEPRQYRYVIDTPPMVGTDYYKHYERYGWEGAGQIGDAVFWRTTYEGDRRPESFALSKDIDRHNTAIYRNLTAGTLFTTALMFLLTMLVWRLPADTPVWGTMLILGADVMVFVLMGYLRRTQRRMELGDRLRNAGPDEPGRLI